MKRIKIAFFSLLIAFGNQALVSNTKANLDCKIVRCNCVVRYAVDELDERTRSVKSNPDNDEKDIPEFLEKLKEVFNGRVLKAQNINKCNVNQCSAETYVNYCTEDYYKQYLEGF